MAKGYWGRRKNVYTVAKNAVEKALGYQFRRLWIARINAGARLNGTTYSQLMGSLRKADVQLNRKVLADLAMQDPAAFTAVVKKAS